MNKQDEFEKMRFTQIYRYIKLNGEFPYKPEIFIEKARLFSIPILERIMLLLFIIKIIIIYINFIYFEGKFFSFTLLMNWSCIIGLFSIIFIDNTENLSSSLVQKISKFVTTTNYQRLINIYIIIVFFFEENYSQYYYPQFNFQVNPGFIFFLYLSIAFFDSQNFTYIMFYLYIWNLLLLIHYITLRNFINFYIPINLVFGIFTLINVMAHNVGTKISKSETFFKFYEALLSIIFKEMDLVLTYNKRIILPNTSSTSFNNGAETGNNKGKLSKRKSTKVFDNIISDSFNESESLNQLGQDIDKIPFDFKKIALPNFEGFEIAMKATPKVDGFFDDSDDDNNALSTKANPVLSFINMLFFLKNNSKCDDTFLSEIENVFQFSIKLTKSPQIQQLLSEISTCFKPRDKILMIVICFLLEAIKEETCFNNPNIIDFIQSKQIFSDTHTIIINFSTDLLEIAIEKIGKMLQELSKSLNFSFLMENSTKLELKLQ